MLCRRQQEIKSGSHSIKEKKVVTLERNENQFGQQASYCHMLFIDVLLVQYSIIFHHIHYFAINNRYMQWIYDYTTNSNVEI